MEDTFNNEKAQVNLELEKSAHKIDAVFDSMARFSVIVDCVCSTRL